MGSGLEEFGGQKESELLTPEARLQNIPQDAQKVKQVIWNKKMSSIRRFLTIGGLLLCLWCSGCSGEVAHGPYDTDSTTNQTESFFDDKTFVEINQNIPYFTEEEKQCTQAFERYSELDELGRCGVAYANICTELMPTEERGAIGQVKPSGWQLKKYDCIDGNYLYNRCHLIGYQLAGENANEKNLITGTRYFNVSGMLPFENQVSDYVKETDNHVLYRVTPLYHGDDLVAFGVEMEAYSVEDEGEGICFHVFVYNCQPGIEIDYATGESRLRENESSAGSTALGEQEYVLNINTKKFHLPTCSSVEQMEEANKEVKVADREDIIADGYAPCQRCRP